MGMADAFWSSLSPTGSGTYSVREPVLGMPGAWVMHLVVRPSNGAPISLSVTDLLR